MMRINTLSGSKAPVSDAFQHTFLKYLKNTPMHLFIKRHNKAEAII